MHILAGAKCTVLRVLYWVYCTFGVGSAHLKLLEFVTTHCAVPDGGGIQLLALTSSMVNSVPVGTYHNPCEIRHLTRGLPL